MLKVRCALAWVLYGIGHAMYVVFDQWSRLGMPGPIYRVYNGLMARSDRLQGDSDGPWYKTGGAR